MTKWSETVDVSDVFHHDLPFEQVRDTVVARLKASRWYKRDTDGRLDQLIDDLEMQDDVEGFDYEWGHIYDEADMDRVWIKTI